MARMKRIIVSSATVAVACAVLCTAGITLAASTSDNRSNGSLTTADLNLSVKAANVRVYSAQKASKDDIGAFGNDEVGYYTYADGEEQNNGKINFSNHDGGVRLDGNSIDISNIMPGDKVEFDISVTSTSTISFYYRTGLFVNATQGETLLNQLDYGFEHEKALSFDRKNVADVEWDTDDGDLLEAVLSDYTEKNISANQADVDTVKVCISLPITASEGKGENVRFYYAVKAVSLSESPETMVMLKTPTGIVGFNNLKDGVDKAKELGISEISVVGSSHLDEGEIVIDELMNFKGVPDNDGNLPVLKGARFIIENSAAATFENISFAGESYIDVSRATALRLNKCIADVGHNDYFDAMTREFLEDNAFIVSGTTLTPVRLTVTDSVIKAGGGSAVNLRSPLNDGTEISGNTFGTQASPSKSAALAFNGANGDSVITIAGNILYGSRAMNLGGTGSTPYLVISRNNTAYGLKDNIFVDGTACAAFVDNGSKTGESALQCANIAEGSLAFGGTDVELNNLNRITAGKITVSEQNISLGAFYSRYVVGSTLQKDVIGLYKNGQLYAYLNALADSETGYVINYIG